MNVKMMKGNGYVVPKTPQKQKSRSSKYSNSRCSNPMKLPKHFKTKGLRRLSKAIKDVYPNLTPQDLICCSCRYNAYRKLKELQGKSKSPVKLQETTQVDLPHVSLSVLQNNLLSNGNMLKDKNECIIVIPLKFIEDSAKCLDGLKKLFHIESCTRAQKIQILKLLPKSWSAINIMNHFDTNLRMINAARKNQDDDLLLIQTLEKGKPLSSEIKTLIENFYLRDDVSYVMPRRKNIISIKDNNGIKQCLQKTLLLLNIKELYQIFKDEYLDFNIGFSRFSTLKPINCILTGSSGTCKASVCSLHQNVKLALLDCSIERLSEKTSFPISSYKDCFDFLLCKAPSDTCYFGRCSKCPKKTYFDDILMYIFHENDISNVTFKQWMSTPELRLETLSKSEDEFAPYLTEKVCDLLPHAFIAMQQSFVSKQIKENLKIGEFQVIVNFAENYAFTVRDTTPELQNSDQVSIYNIAIYYKENIFVKHCNLVIISDCLTHDTVAVYTFNKILIEFLKSKFSTVTKIFYFSDHAPEYYKNDKSLINLAYHKTDFDVDAEWHFYAETHGTGPCDKISAIVKKATIRAGLQSVNNKEVSTSKDLFEWLSATLKLPNIEFRFSPQSDYDANKLILAKRFALSIVVDNLEEQYCLLPISNNNVRVKPYSTSLNYQIANIY